MFGRPPSLRKIELIAGEIVTLLGRLSSRTNPIAMILRVDCTLYTIPTVCEKPYKMYTYLKWVWTKLKNEGKIKNLEKFPL